MSRQEEWIEDVDRTDKVQRLQREWGFKFQVAAEALLQKMGHKSSGHSLGSSQVLLERSTLSLRLEITHSLESRKP